MSQASDQNPYHAEKYGFSSYARVHCAIQNFATLRSFTGDLLCKIHFYKVFEH